MHLLNDKQTLNDLSIFENNNERSILSLFKHAETDGGNKCIDNWISSPLADLSAIQKRQQAIFSLKLPWLETDRSQMDFIEFYLDCNEDKIDASLFYSIATFLFRKIKYNPQRYIIVRGTYFIEQQIKSLCKYAESITSNHPDVFQALAKEIMDSIQTTEFKAMLLHSPKRNNSHRIDQLDYLFRYKRSILTRRFLDIVYYIDAIQTLNKIAQERSYGCPQITTDINHVKLHEFYHPNLKKPVKNNWTLQNNICIFTGSNMAGKSTALKAISICIWLAHCGFPVPAKEMECPVFNGLFTSINLPDSMSEGKSHFYAEVMRIKEILDQVEPDKKYFILFDELFRGTNAKDAYDASNLVINIIKKTRNIFLLISTHILELALKYQHDNECCFYFLESEIKDDELVCYYKVKTGISESRVGYWITCKILKDKL